ncbi:MAG: hypothetical protein AAGH15_14570 [Myxococcota bacterium]
MRDADEMVGLMGEPDALRVLAAAVWADGYAHERQLEAFLAASRRLGEADAILYIAEEITPQEAPAERLADRLGPVSAAALYALASWIAAADARDHPRERLFLDRLRDSLALPAELSRRLRAMAWRLRGARGERAEGKLEALLRASTFFGAERLA